MSTALETVAERFFNNAENRGHANRSGVADPSAELDAGLESGRWLARRSLALVGGTGLLVLDVGCSWGPISIATAESDRVAHVTAIDLEPQALALGNAVLASGKLRVGTSGTKLDFVRAAAERLPFARDSFDLMICHTVIEHVGDVETALGEMLRVLRPGGVLHLQAPNYLWPHEPHLELWMPPLGPKWLVKHLARLKGRDATFVDHLKFVHPLWIERILRRARAQYENLSVRKLEAVIVQGRFDELVYMRRAVPFIRLLHRLHVDRAAVRLAATLRLYPSIEYAISK
jgi:ubiquinone/menaquinone biosynthesis C-methylase UbiE